LKVRLSRAAICGNIEIPEGEYMVALQSESGQINLAGGGRDYKIPATKRRNNSKSKVTSIQYYSGGGKIWSLVVQTPKHGEWVAMLEVK